MLRRPPKPRHVVLSMADLLRFAGAAFLSGAAVGLALNLKFT